MQVLLSALPNFGEIFKITLLFMGSGGWVLFVLGMIYMLWRMYFLEIQHQYVHSQEWVFIHIKVPRENLISTLAVETIFAQLHSLHVGKTFAEKYVEGHIQLWYSLEVVSMGGKVSFVIRLPKKMRDVVESAFYSHYPQAEISEVSDYMSNFDYDPEKPGEVEIFGTEWRLTEDDVIPMKTYKDFEHPAAEEGIIDPLANFFEGMAKMEPHEFFGVQILIQPLADEEWKPRGELKVKQLTGEEMPHEPSFIGFLLKPFEWFARFSYKQAMLGGGHGHAADENKPRNNWLNMTEAEKQRVTLIEQKIGKPGYKTKVRFLYIAPKGKYDPMKKSIITGAYRSLGSVMTNKIKPDLRNTWTHVDYVFSKALEKPYLDWYLNYKKRNIFKGYKNRDIHIGIPGFILNTEELATIYHFPITTETTRVLSAIEKTESKKSQPPANLPIAGSEV